MIKESKETLHFNMHAAIIVNDQENPEVYPPHWHDAAEFTVALKKGCRYRVGDRIYELEAGDILLVWPQQIHGTIRAPKGSALFIQFPAAIIESNLDMVSSARFLYERHHIATADAPEIAKFIHKKIDEIKDIYVSNGRFAETKCKICVSEILLKIGEYVMAEKKDLSELEESAGAGWKYIHMACNYIVENVENELTQTEVAQFVGLSTFYFSKLFKQCMQMTFPAYLSRLRVKRATRYLLNKDLSITDCAFRAGFQSTTTFNKVFREIMGYSPSDFRKLYR